PGAGLAVVPAAHRNADRDFDCIYGAREHCWRERAAPLDHYFRLRPGPWIWILVCLAPNATVRRIPSVDLAALVQNRCRARTASGARGGRSRTRDSVPLRR